METWTACETQKCSSIRADITKCFMTTVPPRTSKKLRFSQQPPKKWIMFENKLHPLKTVYLLRYNSHRNRTFRSISKAEAPWTTAAVAPERLQRGLRRSVDPKKMQNPTVGRFSLGKIWSQSPNLWFFRRFVGPSCVLILLFLHCTLLQVIHC